MRWQGVAFILTIFFLGVLAGCAAGVAWAQEPTTDAKATFDWACKWSKLVQRNRAEALENARCLGVKLPAKLARVTECPARLGDDLDDLPYLYDWAPYGRAWKTQAVALARYVRKTWRRITHPRNLNSAAVWVPLLRHEGWPAAQIPTALKVIWRESNAKPWAVGPGPFYGLFQIWSAFNTGHWNLLDPVVNVRLALQLYHRKGWSPWRATAY